MNNIKLLIIFFFFSVWGFSQSTDTSRVSPPPAVATDTSSNVNPSNSTTERKYPKGYTKYKNNKDSGKEKTDIKEKLYFGCNIALRYYSYNGASVFYYDLSPHVGYKFTEDLSAGIQIVYNNSVLTRGNSSASYNVIGGGVFARYVIYKSIFVQAEYDLLSVPQDYLGNAVLHRTESDEKMAGLGYKSMLSDKLSYYLVLMYDFNPTYYSPYYSNPLVYRAGLVWNF